MASETDTQHSPSDVSLWKPGPMPPRRRERTTWPCCLQPLQPIHTAWGRPTHPSPEFLAETSSKWEQNRPVVLKCRVIPGPFSTFKSKSTQEKPHTSQQAALQGNTCNSSKHAKEGGLWNSWAKCARSSDHAFPLMLALAINAHKAPEPGSLGSPPHRKNDGSSGAARTCNLATLHTLPPASRLFLLL